MSEHVDDTMRQADEAIDALKRTKPSNAAQARVRSAELMRLNKLVLDAGKQVIAANARKAISGAASNGNGTAPAGAGLTDGDLEALAEGIVPVIRQIATDIAIKIVTEMLAEPIARLAELETRKGLAPLASRLAQLEQRGYKGIWDEARGYSAEQEVTYGGNRWFSENGAAAGVRPGTDDSSWQLTHKTKGRQ